MTVTDDVGDVVDANPVAVAATDGNGPRNPSF